MSYLTLYYSSKALMRSLRFIYSSFPRTNIYVTDYQTVNALVELHLFIGSLFFFSLPRCHSLGYRINGFFNDFLFDGNVERFRSR